MKGSQFQLIAFFWLNFFVFDCVRVAVGEKVDSTDIVNVRWNNTQNEAFNCLSALSFIRKGEVDNALELLEFNLDAIVIRLWKMRGDLSQDDRQTADKVLGFVQVYRNQYPREVNPDMEIEKLRLKRYKMAKKILDKLDDVGVPSENRPDRMQSDTIVDDLQSRIDIIGIDGVYEELRFSCNRYILVRNWDRAESTLKQILDVIRDPDDDRHVRAKKRLQEIQETGSTDILER